MKEIKVKLPLNILLRLMHIALYFAIATPSIWIINHFLGLWGVIASFPVVWKMLVMPSQTELACFVCEKILKLARVDTE